MSQLICDNGEIACVGNGHQMLTGRKGQGSACTVRGALTDRVEESEESRTGPSRLLRGDLGRLMCSRGTTSFGVIRLK